MRRDPDQSRRRHDQQCARAWSPQIGQALRERITLGTSASALAGPRISAAGAGGRRLARCRCGRGASRVHPAGTLADDRTVLGRARSCSRGCDGIRRMGRWRCRGRPGPPRASGHDVNLYWPTTRARARGTVVVPTAAGSVPRLSPTQPPVLPSDTAHPLSRCAAQHLGRGDARRAAARRRRARDRRPARHPIRLIVRGRQRLIPPGRRCRRGPGTWPAVPRRPRTPG